VRNKQKYIRTQSKGNVIIPKGRGIRKITTQSTELRKRIRRRRSRKYEKQRKRNT
jgi:hypothetical protein